MYTVSSTMDSKESSTSVKQDANSGEIEDKSSELCPGFKDVDAFVKVSEQKKRASHLFVCVS